MKSQRLARMATAWLSSNGGYIQPDVTPVGFDFDGDYFYVGGMNILMSTRYKNVLKIIRLRLSLMILKSVEPWDPRGIRVSGTADVVTRQGGYMDSTGHANPSYIRMGP